MAPTGCASGLLSLCAAGVALIVSRRLCRIVCPPRTAASVLQKYASDLIGKRVLVTGACTGVGHALAQALSELDGITVLWHGRSLVRVEGTLAELPEIQRARCSPVVGDLASLCEVDAMARSLIDAPPDVIVCCAGIATLPERKLSRDGYEMQFAVNHLSHFCLVQTLMPSLSKSARIVAVSSDLHHVGPKYQDVNLDDLNSDKSYSMFGAYIGSKYCNYLMAVSLASKNLMAVSCTPGAVKTQIDRHLSAPLRFGFRYCGPGLVASLPEEGAATLAHAVAAPDVQPGAFYAGCCEASLAGGFGLGKESQVWEASNRLVENARARW